MFDLINEIWQTMRTNKLRTALTGLAVAWGIFMLIILLGISKGVLTSFQSSSLAQNPNKINVYPGNTSMPYKGLKEGRYIQLRDRNLDEIKNDNPNDVASATAEMNQSGTISTPLDYITTSYSGVFPGTEKMLQLPMIYGRFINEKDLNDMRKVIVLNKKDAETLFKNIGSSIGKTVDVNGIAFTLVGIYEHEWRSGTFIPYTTARALSGFDDKVYSIQVDIKGVKNMEDAERVERNIKSTLAKYNQFDPDDESAVWMWNRFSSYLNSQEAAGVLNTAMWVIGLLTLITGIVGVSNIMFVSVRERTHEIGIRRAIGARPHNILLQVIIESVAMTTLFGYIGILLGTIGNEIMAQVFADGDFIKDPRVDLSLAIEVTVVLIVSGALAGIFPAMRALKIRPVEALRTE
ncbi:MULTISPECIES: ABC transporter permease [unclassified Muribaculum]|jgi:putative ABC transporter, permease protein|uniref:ABC transporter permease n=7 Tax=Muribaculaceae TaxID=2005473 RepID=UPI000F4612A9|nr:MULTISPECIES: ABC transporter permease [unclassified Muribaculum]MCX4278533.1 ABC transporter permease [Muribaculum sp.]ROT12668.1 ABC transporter permease [Muribaculaceae bacterium Isolate-102 (HZI)]TGY03106.1 ABC transporter permease [Muribaculum sp. NM65_B17]THG41807.1 ABC transporter permease [Muribaculaceae bacterium]